MTPPMKGKTKMENNEQLTLTVFEKPTLQDQVITAAVGAVVTIVATVAVTAGSEILTQVAARRREKKLAKLQAKVQPEQE